MTRSINAGEDLPGLLGALQDLVAPPIGTCADALHREVSSVIKILDDFVRWRLRGSYLRYLLSRDPSRAGNNRPVQQYYSMRWQVIHGRGSPSGQIQQDCTGKISSLVAARKLSLVLGKITHRHFGEMRNDVAPPRHALIAIHSGYKNVYENYRYATGRSQFISIETVAQSIIDLHRAANSRRGNYNGVNLSNCHNHRCSGRHLPLLHHHRCEFLSVCPWCEHHLVIIPNAGIPME